MRKERTNGDEGGGRPNKETSRMALAEEIKRKQ